MGAMVQLIAMNYSICLLKFIPYLTLLQTQYNVSGVLERKAASDAEFTNASSRQTCMAPVLEIYQCKGIERRRPRDVVMFSASLLVSQYHSYLSNTPCTLYLKYI